MNSYNKNKCDLGGRLQDKPVLGHTLKEIPFCNLRVVINDRKRKGSQVDFIEVSAYGDLAIQVVEKCVKGTTIDVEAHIRYDKDKGKLNIIADNIQFIHGAIH